MNILHIEMSNCFGIHSMSHDFEYPNGRNTQLLYAPNGCMKTSFARALRSVSKQSKENMWDNLHVGDPAYKGVCVVKLNGVDIDAKNLFIADGEEDLDTSKVFANFLASAQLKAKYDEIYAKLDECKKALITRLNKESHSTNCEEELLAAFRNTPNESIFTVLERLAAEVTSDLPIFDFKYNEVFDSKGSVREFVSANYEKLQAYFDQFSSLINNSSIFHSKNGHTFGTFQAAQLEKSVADEAFFAVDHKILFNEHESPIESVVALKQLFDDEKNHIVNDAELRSIFDEITKEIEKKAELRTFKAVIDSHPDWIPELLDFDGFCQKVWKGHLSKPELRVLLSSYNEVYQANKANLERILREAGEELELWKDIVDIFNDRFDVPFRVEIENQRDVILKQSAAKLRFFYNEDAIPYPKEKDDLLKILSRGERRAFHILQLIFEFESRKMCPEVSVIVFDDIADSFDYQNKYAIIEYIKDLSEKCADKFLLVVMTHNYDFYRTVHSRLSNKPVLLMALRNSSGNITLEQGQYTGNVFVNIFLEHDDNDKKFISMIPYVRNLVEYTKGVEDSGYLLLTSCLHQKSDTQSITECDVIRIMSGYTQGKGMKRIANESKIYDTIINTADSIVAEVTPDPVLIENKIVLSIAIRLLAEKYMHDKVIAAGGTEEDLRCSGNQTGHWTGKYKSRIPNDPNRSVIERVNMMTPEIIHLNSFMYEPLIDMSVNHLIKLYNDCKALA